MVVSAAALVLASLCFMAYDQYVFREAIVRNVSSQAQIIALNSAAALTFNDPVSALNTLVALKSSPRIIAAGILRRDGTMFAEFSNDQRRGPGAMPSLEPGASETYTIEGGELLLARSILLDNKAVGEVYVRVSMVDLKQRLLRYLAIAGAVLLLALLAALPVSAKIRQSVATPMEELAEVARKVSREKNYATRARTSREFVELSTLSDAFNEMLTQIQARDRTLADERAHLEERVEERTRQLAAANRELEAFSYSVSHDLRGPLEAISGFSYLLQTQHGAQLDAAGAESLEQISSQTRRMAELIEDLLNLSRVNTSAMERESVDLSAIFRSVAKGLQLHEPERTVEVVAPDCMSVECDPRLMRIVFENLLRNAWKFTSKKARARIEFGCMEQNTHTVYFVRDNGVGFDPKHAGKLFKPFQRLHSASDFAGTGVGLATVQRIIHRHGGEIWADAMPNEGATFYFTLE